MHRSLAPFLGMLVLFLALPAGAAPGVAVSLPAGVVKVVRGEVFLERGQQRIPATVGSLVLVGDVVITGPTGAVGITLRDNSLLSLGPDGALGLTDYSFDTSTHDGNVDATISRGTLSFVSGKIGKRSPEAVKIRTPISVIGVRGTEFLISVGGA